MNILSESTFLEAFSHFNCTHHYELVSNSTFHGIDPSDARLLAGFLVSDIREIAALSDEALANITPTLNNSTLYHLSIDGDITGSLGFAIVLGYEGATLPAIIYTPTQKFFSSELAISNARLTLSVNSVTVPEGTQYTAYGGAIADLSRDSVAAYIMTGRSRVDVMSLTTFTKKKVFPTLTPAWCASYCRSAVMVDAESLPLNDIPSLCPLYEGKALGVSAPYVSYFATQAQLSYPPIVLSYESLSVVSDPSHPRNLLGLGEPLPVTVDVLAGQGEGDSLYVATVPTPGTADENWIYQVKSNRSHSSGIGRKGDLLTLLQEID